MIADLARKANPEPRNGLEGIVGHEKHKAYFNQLFNNEGISHAYCFSGLEGIGKRRFAMALARAVLCMGHEQDFNKFDSGNHPDFLELVPEGTSIKTEQVESVHHFMHIKPFLAEKKVVLIDDAHLMTEVAQNKLLKLLEEPPGHSVFILVTNNYLKLLETIRSRVVTLNFHPLSQEDLLAVLADQGVTGDLEIIAAAMGSVYRYLRFVEDQGYKEAIYDIRKGLKCLCEGKHGQWLTLLKRFETLKEDSGDLLDYILLWFLDLSLVKEGLGEGYLRLSFEYENMVQCKQYVTTHALSLCREIVQDAIVALRNQQNYALVVESMFFDIQEAIHGKSHRR